ncbi:MAG: hypothetical protein H3C47_08955 [Candidatus Cloacimonetes bacterium]|nr:hypothetical protein [Candidatus Cloacimonadota bacterium]
MKNAIFIAALVLGTHFGTVTRSEAFLGAIWETVTGWFGGGKKQDKQIEAQLVQALQNTNQSQNALILAVNAVVDLQGSMQNLNDPTQKAELERRMQAMQAAIDQNAQTYGQLMAVRDALSQAGKINEHQAQFAPYMQKQQEIEAVYPKVEDRFNELKAFSSAQPTPANDMAPSATPASDSNALAQAPAVSATPWTQPEIRALIDQHLKSQNRDQWGGPINPLVKAYQPPGAFGKDRYQYLIETFPDIRRAIEGKIATGQSAAPLVNAPQAPASSSTASGFTPAPAAPVSSTAPKTYKHMVPTNNLYDNAALREKRNEVYQRMLKMQAEGKMNSEEYKDVYLEYTKLSDQLR